MKNILSIIVVLVVIAVVNGKPKDPCLEISGNIAVAFAGDCKKYWRCYNRRPGTVHMCPKGQYYSPAKTYCTEDDSFCTIINSRDQVTDNTVEPLNEVPVTDGIVEPLNEVPITDDTVEPLNEIPVTIVTAVNKKPKDPCLEISGNIAVAFAGDCKKYWRCYNKRPGTVHMCPKGQYYSPAKTYCTEDDSFCTIINSRDQVTDGTVEPLNEVPVNEESLFITVPGTHGICSSCNGLSEGSLVPVIGLCEKYCVCGNNFDRNVMLTCPSGLYFNKDQQACDWPLSSGCTPYTYQPAK